MAFGGDFLEEVRGGGGVFASSRIVIVVQTRDDRFWCFNSKC